MNLAEKMHLFAMRRHYYKLQVRKWSEEPYIVHPEAVVKIMFSAGIRDDVTLAAGFGHDLIEDTDTTYVEILDKFGREVANMIEEVTDPPKAYGNRAKRKARVVERMTTASQGAKTIKLADGIDNAPSISREGEKDFAQVWFEEKLKLLPALEGGNPFLFQFFQAQVHDFFKGYYVEKFVLPADLNFHFRGFVETLTINTL